MIVIVGIQGFCQEYGSDRRDRRDRRDIQVLVSYLHGDLMRCCTHAVQPAQDMRLLIT